MNRKELINAIADETGMTRSEVDRVIDALIDQIQKQSAAGERVTLVGFGTFDVVETKTRMARNPKTGAQIEIAAGRKPRFKVSPVYRDLVAGAGN